MSESVLLIGGGLAGLAAACALAEEGFATTLFERRPVLGGRASSFTFSQAFRGETPTRDTDGLVDNSQHILMRCCTNLLAFYARVGVADRVRFRPDLAFLDRAGRVSRLAASPLPAPLHLLPSFARLKFLGVRDKIAVARAFVAMLRERDTPADETFAQWMGRHGQTPHAIEGFWRPVVVSALNEEAERVAATAALTVFRDGFLRHRDAYVMGIPALPLGEMHGPPALAYLQARGGRVVAGTPVREILVGDGKARGVRLADDSIVTADWYICAVPFHALGRLLPAGGAGRPAAPALECSPITAVHLWFDRPVTTLDSAALVDRDMHWMFNKGAHFGEEMGTHLSLVVSASRDLLRRSRREILDLALADVCEAFPAAREAEVVRAIVTKDLHATFSQLPGSDALRPAQKTALPNLFLAGDWTRTGWPSTMEGAVRSGNLAAEALLSAAGRPKRLLAPDLPVAPLVRRLGYRGS